MNNSNSPFDMIRSFYNIPFNFANTQRPKLYVVMRIGSLPFYIDRALYNMMLYKCQMHHG